LRILVLAIDDCGLTRWIAALAAPVATRDNLQSPIDNKKLGNRQYAIGNGQGPDQRHSVTVADF
jgi:hypothetical protein